VTDGKANSALLLTKSHASPWEKSEQSRRIKDACKLAKVDPPLSFHVLRHSYASLLVEAGTPLAFVADALGHTDTGMVGKHYAHLAPNYIHNAIRANLPTFCADAKSELPPAAPQAIRESSVITASSDGVALPEVQNESDFSQQVVLEAAAADPQLVAHRDQGR
jgi:hypothetical protein